MPLDPKLFPPTKNSTDAEWLSWYDEILKRFGSRDAATLFNKAWNVRGSAKSNTSTLRTAMDKNGIHISADTIAGVVADKASDFGDFAGNLFSMGKIYAISLFVIVVVLVFIIVWRLATPQTVAVATKAAMI